MELSSYNMQIGLGKNPLALSNKEGVNIENIEERLNYLKKELNVLNLSIDDVTEFKIVSLYHIVSLISYRNLKNSLNCVLDC